MCMCATDSGYWISLDWTENTMVKVKFGYM